MIFKPQLACDYDPAKLRHPCWASFKLDGLRAVVRDGVVYSRSNKPIPNKHVQAKFKHLEHFDGELIVGNPCSTTVFRDTTSIVMSHDKPADDVNFYVFDHIGEMKKPYSARVMSIRGKGFTLLDQIPIENHEQLVEFEAQALEAGYEGLILRDPAAPYKMGRSTVNEGYLLKVKSFSDFECAIVGFQERVRNDNPAVISELGRTKRSSHKDNKHGRGDLGALLLRTPDGIEFACGTGFTDDERSRIWSAQSAHLGKLAKIKYFSVGGYLAPRHPVWMGLRDPLDM